jgi:predicted RNA binding protein YcfA (HicA-like mRNA interferase family)
VKKIPRDVSAAKMVKLLNKNYNYQQTRQTGSHIRLTTQMNGEHHITIPNHNPIKLGTLSHIINDIAIHLNKSKDQIVDELFSND